MSQPSITSACSAFVGRQPIFHPNLETFGYELLFRSNRENQAEVYDGSRATAELILNTFTEIGLDTIVGELPAFINISEEFLTRGFCFALPRQRVVLEILEDVRPTPTVLNSIEQLRNEGYTIALDDFIHSPELEPLVELANIIKVDLPCIPKSELRTHVNRLRQFDVQLLAEKIETQEEFSHCAEMGFELFQGYFLCRPTVIEKSRVVDNSINNISIASKLHRPDVSLHEVTELMTTAPTLAYKLLRFVNSAVYGLSQKVESISHAVSLLGVRQIQNFICLTGIVDAAKRKPEELVRTVLVRAKMAELLGRRMGNPSAEPFFLVGMLSGLDALLDVPRNRILEDMPISQSIKAALTTNEGTFGTVLNCVLAYERGDWTEVTCGQLNSLAIRDSYFDALDWANHALVGMG